MIPRRVATRQDRVVAGDLLRKERLSPFFGRWDSPVFGTTIHLPEPDTFPRFVRGDAGWCSQGGGAGATRGWGHSPIEGGAEVIVLGVEPVEPFLLFGTDRGRLHHGRQVSEPGGLARADLGCIADSFQFFPGELADRLQHPKARFALRFLLPDQTVIDEHGDSAEDGDGKVGRRESGVGSQPAQLPTPD